MKTKHFLYCPLLGLGLYNGSRGASWLRSRIKVMKHFVVPSLQSQTCKDFTLWISVRPEDKNDKQIKGLKAYFETIKEFKTVFTYSGLCFYDDKFEDSVARERLTNNLHYMAGEMYDHIGEADTILMTIRSEERRVGKEGR